jgi:type IX secretion system PorP/SprF family membrane protein
MKIKLYIAGVMLLLSSTINGQHLPMFTQYFFNDYVVNTAVAGSRPWYDVRSAHRYQWAGIVDSPRTFTLSMCGPNKKQNMGLGFYLFTDNVGPTRRTGIQLGYAYHVKLSQKIKMSFSLSGGLLQYMVDGSKITLHDKDDAVISNGLQAALVPDIKFSFYLYHEDWSFGASLPQIVQNKLYFFDWQTSSLSKLEDHYFFHGAYTFHFGSDWDLQPGFLVKYVKPLPPQLDIVCRLMFKQQVYIGGSFRTQDAFSLMTGYTYKNNLTIGYAFDITTTNLANYSTGTHEIVAGIRFVKKKEDSGKKMF